MAEHVIRCGHKNFAVHLCDTGEALYRIWIETLGRDADPEDVYLAMQDYFSHKNGVRDRNGKPVVSKCFECYTAELADTPTFGKE